MAESRRLDASSFRGLAHPLRLRLLDLLRLEGPSNSTQLAKRVGESTGTVSWHLRQLAQHGFIEEDPGHESKRERWWRAPVRAGVFDTEEAGDAAVEPIEELLRHNFDRVSRHLRSDVPDEWRNVGTISDWSQLRLTPSQATALTAELSGVVERYLNTEPAAGARAVVVQLQVFPASP
ncbi:helix-turn-helix domain-containing protein [Cryptosporangium phraense]|uniref:Helix-turn-helix domain-containing protein n=1 Tax=Cryptosporangium phraense TaxID=2593070 RepID=A0A545AFN1_9ACTN|nr:helix-turn-helix domain-containing protein [Cryptosporangium phraense]TQS40091.1 helix-turn-helix domain-containing protein [Cryptosporangium phraense]